MIEEFDLLDATKIKEIQTIKSLWEYFMYFEVIEDAKFRFIRVVNYKSKDILFAAMAAGGVVLKIDTQEKNKNLTKYRKTLEKLFDCHNLAMHTYERFLDINTVPLLKKELKKQLTVARIDVTESYECYLNTLREAAKQVYQDLLKNYGQ